MQLINESMIHCNQNLSLRCLSSILKEKIDLMFEISFFSFCLAVITHLLTLPYFFLAVRTDAMYKHWNNKDGLGTDCDVATLQHEKQWGQIKLCAAPTIQNCSLIESFMCLFLTSFYENSASYENRKKNNLLIMVHN